MSRNRNNYRPDQKPVEPLPMVPAHAPPKVRKAQAVPKYRQCPLCYGGRGGVGNRKWQTGKGGVTKRCYQCDTCGHDWTVTVRTVSALERIEWNEVEVDSQDVHLETRD